MGSDTLVVACCPAAARADKVEDTIEGTRAYPEQLALKGEIDLKPHEVAMKIGELFIVVRAVRACLCVCECAIERICCVRACVFVCVCVYACVFLFV